MCVCVCARICVCDISDDDYRFVVGAAVSTRPEDRERVDALEKAGVDALVIVSLRLCLCIVGTPYTIFNDLLAIVLSLLCR